MYAEERHRAIAEMVTKRGRVAVAELAAHFDVTAETVRRDLAHLDRLNLVRRVHGGAVLAEPKTTVAPQLTKRDHVSSAERERIAWAAISLLPKGGCSLLLDAGQATARMAALLPPSDRWTVITHAVPVAAALAPLTNVELQLLPGRVHTASQAAVGYATVAAIRQFRADLSFVGTNGISVQHGLSTSDPEEAATKQAMVESAQRVVILTDSSNVGQVRTVRFSDLDDVDVLVTDNRITTADINAFEAAGLDVVRA
jgi:DeoR family fructose operon transcriptional repressor